MTATRPDDEAELMSGIDELLAAKEMILVCGSGGVGKTTIAAALGLAATIDTDAKVLVLTVDPARRLADSLGIGALGNVATRIPDSKRPGGRRAGPRGELWAAMLDTKAGWDDLVERYAPDARIRGSVLANPLYQNVTRRFAHSHDYLAMEQLHAVHASGEYDLVIVDTPPSRNALDILDAPSRMVEFFGSKLLKWLTVPYRSRLFTIAAKPFNQIADRVLGSRFLQDIAEFFILFQAMEKGFVGRAREVEALLGDPRTSFVIVSTLEAAPAHEAGYLARQLHHRELPLGAIVANRVLPRSLRTRAATASARKLQALTAQPADDPAGELATLAAAVAQEIGDPADARQVAGVLGALADNFEAVAAVAKREAERRAELAAHAPLLVDVEALPSDVHDLTGLAAIASQLLHGAGSDRAD